MAEEKATALTLSQLESRLWAAANSLRARLPWRMTATLACALSFVQPGRPRTLVERDISTVLGGASVLNLK